MDPESTEKLREQLQRYRGEYRRVADESGLKYDWVRQFASGGIQRPFARTLERLRAWLVAERLKELA